MKTKGIYFLYRTLQAFALPALLLYFVLRGLGARAYWRSLPQRLGFLPRSFKQTGPGAIWLHAVSVGEVLSCVEFLRRLQQEFPHTAVFVSVSTLAGRAAAGDKLAGIAAGVFYAPADLVFSVRRVLRVLRPSVVVVAETEIWPNLYREIKRTGAALAIVNGRISDRAFPQYRILRGLIRPVLAETDAILAQSDEMRDRFLALGAPAGRAATTGNFKYDVVPRPLSIDLPPGKIWIAASTMPPAAPGDPDEDDAVISAYIELTKTHPDLRLILAPRKPERFTIAAQKLDAAGIEYVRRSSGRPAARLLLLDTIGELAGLFAAADVVFMGGTLVSRGGHNLLEPAFFGKPVIAGPHLENFRAIADEFRAHNAYVEIAVASDLAPAVARLLDCPEQAAEFGRRAKACGEARRGATARAVETVRELYRTHIPKYRPAQPWFLLRWILAQGWKFGARRRQKSDLARRRALDVPVISVGNLTMGGTGKTPCVLLLAEKLRERGRRPAILTRGYKRSSPEPHLVIAPGDVASAYNAGDEPQIFVRAAVAPVGVGAARYETAMLLRRRFEIDTFLLDDGFQHLRLARSLDILLIDGWNPLGGGELFPLGRLREPVEALARAGAVVITRSDLTDTAPAIEHLVRRYNPHAPVFRAHYEPVAWVDQRSGDKHPVAFPPFARAGVFCGLGNPHAFRAMLGRFPIEQVDCVDFEDHHRYRPHELERLAHRFQALGAEALITTQKDSMNLCEDSERLLAPLPLYWLEVRAAIDRESEFVDLVARHLK